MARIYRQVAFRPLPRPRRTRYPPPMRSHSWVLLTAAAATAAVEVAPAQTTSRKPDVPRRDREMAMALSAAPAHLRDGAAVWVLESTGFVKLRDSKNGFSCIVNRDHPLALKPTCYDAEGTRTILPKVLQVGQWLMQGKSVTEIDRLVREGFATGRFVAPRRPGVAYMLSGEIRNVNERTGQLESFPPHVMFYAPGLTDADIGSTGRDEGLPFIAYEGPHGFMIMLAPRQRGDSGRAASTDTVCPCIRCLCERTAGRAGRRRPSARSTFTAAP
jgi:hypothetical protein